MAEQQKRQSKQWKDMNAGERAGGIIGLIFIALVILFAIKLAIPSGSQPTNDGGTSQTTDTSSAQPTVAQQVSAWWDQYGYIVQTFGKDASKTSTDAGNGNVTQMGADCKQMLSDVQKAQSFPAIPDPQTASNFSSAMSYYADGSQDCIDGANNYDASLIRKAAGEISQGNTQIGVAANDIKRLEGN